MKTFDLYILRETLIPLFTALLVGLLVLLIERALQLLDLVMGVEGPLRIVLEIMGYLMPQYVGLALPISLVLGVMVAFSKLGRAGEIDALNGAGVGLVRLAAVPVVASLVVALVTTIAIGYLKPFGRYAYQATLYAVTNSAFGAFLRAGVFTEMGDTTFLVQDVNTDEAGFGRIFLYTTDDNEHTAITARSGDLVRSEEMPVPILRLYDGIRLATRQRGVRPEDGQASPLRVLRFQQLQTEVGRNNLELFRPRGVDEREFTLGELWRRRHNPPPGVRVSDMVAELHSRLARIASVPFLPLLAIVLARGQRRSDRSFGLAAGLLILVLYNQALDLGKNIAETGAMSHWVVIWPVVGLFAGACVWSFYRAATRLPSGGGLMGPLARMFRRGTAASGNVG